MPSANTAASPGGSDTTCRDWSASRFMVAPTSSRSSAAGSRCSTLSAVFLIASGDQLGRDLLGDDDALAVGADLGEQAGEQLDRVRAGAVRPGPQQPVRLLQHDHVPQAVGRASGLRAQPQVLDDPDEQGADDERLVLVVGHVLEREHDVAVSSAPMSAG